METLYRETPEKTREKGKNPPPKTKKTSPNKIRWDKAVNAVSIVELLKHLELQKDNEPVCPYCQSQSTLEVKEEEKKFRCTSCKKKGTSISLIRKVKGVSNWEAIAYLENLAAIRKQEQEQKQNQEKLQPPTPTPSKKPQRSSRIPEEELEQLKRSINLEELIRESGIAVKRQGSNLLAKCPFHNDQNASLSISNNLWHCFGCGKGGSVIDWVIESQRVEFRQAVDILREKYPALAPIPQQAAKPVTRKEVSPDNQPLLKRTIHYYHQTLKQNSAALEYLMKRGIHNQEAIDYFKIGFAERGRKLNLPPKTQQEGKRLREQLSEIGILRATGHEHFAGSIVIPIINEKGEVSEVYGRKIHDNLRKGTAYHLYLPGPHKGIFNPKCLQSQQIILTESLIDALSFWVHGFRNVTATYGTQGFTQEHLLAFKNHQIKKVYIAFDADIAGDKAAQKVAEKLLAHGIECYRVVFPWGKDANQVICESKTPRQDLQNLLGKAIQLEGILPSLAAQTTAAKEKNSHPQTNPSLQNGSPSPLAAPREEATKEKNITIPEKYKLLPQIKGETIEINIYGRFYRIRGFYKNLSFDSMRVNIRVSQQDRLHVDSLELYNARQRNQFIKTVSQELGIKPEIIKYDVNRILLCLEQLQVKHIEETLNPKKKKVILSEKEKQEALALYRNPNLLKIIVQHFHKIGLIGEYTNAVVCYLALTSRKLDDPLHIIIQALSGAGKTALMNAALSFIPEEDVIRYTAMTGQSLFYMHENDLKHKILAVSEEEGAEKAAYSLKILQSEKGLSIASTGKDPKTGRHKTHEYKVNGPVQTILTTTSPEIDEELQNRNLVLTANEKRAQTQAIHQQQRENQTIEGIFSKKTREEIIKLHQNAQRLLQPIMIVNPYAKELTFRDSQLRSRRDHVKYLTLIKAITLLHQFQRPIKTTTYQGEQIRYIEVTLEDIKAANHLISEVLGTSIDELAPQTRHFLKHVCQMVNERCQAEKIEMSDCLFTRRDIREYTGWSDTQVRVHLRRLVDFEYLIIHSGNRGTRFVYELAYQREGDDGQNFLMGLIDVGKLRKKL